MSQGQVTKTGLIGSSIRSFVSNQLKIRQDALANKGTTPEWQKLYTGKTAWVKLSSSVNVNGDSGTKAKNNILTARGITGNSGINPGYNTSANLGVRPIPGLTGISIQQINRFGTLRNAVVEFKVYDVERLSDLETLYMRPGFSVLLEWGHTAYKTSAGVSTSPKTVSGFFGSTVSASNVEQQIVNLQQSSGGNYAGLFGYIKNFQWSFNQDGSYNCRVEIISKGELLESLQYAIYPPTKPKNPNGSQDNLDKDRSMLHKVLYGLQEVAPLYPQLVNNDLTNAIEDQDIANMLAGRFTAIGTFSDNTAKKDPKQTLAYIRLGDLLKIINKVVLLKNNKEPITPFDPDIISKYTTHALGHFSGNPGICMLPKTSGAYRSFASTFYLAAPESESIHSIWINVDYAITELDDATDDRTGQTLIFGFIQNLLNGMEGALGGINEFDIAYDEELNVHYIVDRRYIEPTAKIGKLRVSGKKTTVSNLSISSKLSPTLGSLIAISAQANKNVSDVGVEVENLFKWNEGLVDRVITERVLTETPGVYKIDPVVEASRKVYEAVKNFENYIYIPSDFRSLISSHAIAQKSLLQNDISRSGGTKRAPGIIPFELSITLDGISGFRIGEVFQIEDDYIFPEKYRGVIAFIILGIEHSIKNNRWVTTIKAQTVTT